MRPRSNDVTMIDIALDPRRRADRMSGYRDRVWTRRCRMRLGDPPGCELRVRVRLNEPHWQSARPLNRSGQVRFITRPKSRTMRATT